MGGDDLPTQSSDPSSQDMASTASMCYVACLSCKQEGYLPRVTATIALCQVIAQQSSLSVGSRMSYPIRQGCEYLIALVDVLSFDPLVYPIPTQPDGMLGGHGQRSALSVCRELIDRAAPGTLHHIGDWLQFPGMGQYLIPKLDLLDRLYRTIGKRNQCSRDEAPH
jgi:hypothetical protein